MDMEIQDEAKEGDRFLHLRFALFVYFIYLFIYLFIVPMAL
jgi:hypothetical protein